MSKYPNPVTADVLPKYAHISDDEVRRDIADTEAEIPNVESLITAMTVIAQSHPDQAARRMADFRATGYRDQNTQRRQFIEFLNRLLAARAAASEVPA